jgi:hypothetical protein
MYRRESHARLEGKFFRTREDVGRGRQLRGALRSTWVCSRPPTAAPDVRRVCRACLNARRWKSSVQAGEAEGQGKRQSVPVRWGLWEVACHGH